VRLTEQAPGVQDIESELAFDVPVQLCGPVTESLPSVPTVPVNPSNGAANVR
jgi:hypothetical protein